MKDGEHTPSRLAVAAWVAHPPRRDEEHVRTRWVVTISDGRVFGFFTRAAARWFALRMGLRTTDVGKRV